MDEPHAPTTAIRVAVIVPVLDEVAALPDFHADLLAASERWRFAGAGCKASIVYVDDGSTDGSTDLLRRFAAASDNVDVLVLRRNFGKSAALMAGFDHALASTDDVDLIVTLDADGQDDPRQVGKLLVRLAQGADLVGGLRRNRNDRRTKRAASRAYNRVSSRLTGVNLRDLNTGMKAMRAEVAEALRLYGELHRFIPVLAAHEGYAVDEVAIVHRARNGGASKFTSPLRFVRTVLDLVTVLFLTRFGQRPLYLFGPVGALIGLTGFAILLWLTGEKLLTGAGIGDRPLLDLGVLLTLVGVQVFSVGLLGDVIRHSHASESPTYQLRHRIRGGTPVVERPDNVVDLRQADVPR